MLELLAYVAQKEREKTRARQAYGIAIAKANGKYKGRKLIHRANFPEVYTMWRNKKITAVKAMEILNLKKDTFYRLAHGQGKRGQGKRAKANKALTRSMPTASVQIKQLDEFPSALFSAKSYSRHVIFMLS